jgi:hypothetical protein
LPPPVLASSDLPPLAVPDLREDSTSAFASGFVNCTPNIRTAVSRHIRADVVNFREARNRLGAVLDVYCTGADRIQSMDLTAKFAVEDSSEDDGYRAITGHYGDQREDAEFSTTIENPKERTNIVRGLRRFCDINQGGRRRYVVVGTIKIRVDNALDPPRRNYNTDRNRPVRFSCPDRGKRFERQKNAFVALSRYDLITRRRGSSPSRMLRRRLGDPPWKPEGVKRAWDAHHTVPRGRAPTGTFGVVQAVLFRCSVHPNESVNGVYLRGHGLRKRLNDGSTNPAYRKLREYDEANGTHLADRYYHPSTFRRSYYTRLLTHFDGVWRDERYPAGCPSGTYEQVRDLLDDANGELRVGRFGGEESGN